MARQRKITERMLGQDDIDSAISEISELSRREGIPVVLVGGCALQLFGSRRLTGDVDIVAEVWPESLSRAEPLSFGGYSTRTPRGVALDWIMRSDDFAHVYTEALAFGCEVEGVPLRVAPPEYLAIMKMIAGRDKDQLDLLGLIQSGELDVQHTRRLIKRLLGAYAAKEFDSVVEEASWRKLE